MPVRKTVTVKTALAIFIASFIAATAHAHPALETAVPGDGATVSSPKEIRLTFSENLIAKFSGLTVKDQSGHLVEIAAPVVDPSHKSQLVVPIAKPLPPGTYNVDWHAVATDTHRVTGHFSFKVAQ